MASVSAALAAVLYAALAAPHPMHTSVTELVHAPATHTVTVVVRVFADDFAAAVGGAGDSLAAGYLRSRFVLSDRTGVAVLLQWERSERAGDALLLYLRGHAPAGVAGGTLRQSILCERFSDQVNVVRLQDGGRSASLLFVSGDGPKALP